jgi:predicted ATPase
MTRSSSLGNTMTRRIRIAVTGGPGGGKSTATQLLRRELGERVIVVPEAATLLFSGGFPRHATAPAQAAVQRAIFHVQHNLEDVQAAQYPDRLLLCDRGTLDGVAYWPEGVTPGFFETLGTTVEAELARYDGVIFLQTAAAGGHSIGLPTSSPPGALIEGGNPARIESNAQATALDEALQRVWRAHPRFVFIPNHRSFMKKLTDGIGALTDMARDLGFALGA